MLPEGNEIKSLDVLSNFVLLNKSIPKNTKVGHKSLVVSTHGA